jgi:hypothetical protein
MIEFKRMVCKDIAWFYTIGSIAHPMAETAEYKQYKRLDRNGIALLCVLKKEGLRPFVLVTWTHSKETAEARIKFNDEVAKLLVEEGTK